MNEFSYANYVQLIESMKNAIPLLDFADVKKETESFFILRHDVEFSVEKAYEMALIEQNVLGITSSYFFQTRNYTYNPIAFKNMALIRSIYEMGHKIGLHVNTSGISDFNNISQFIKHDVNFLQHELNIPIDRVIPPKNN